MVQMEKKCGLRRDKCCRVRRRRVETTICPRLRPSSSRAFLDSAFVVSAY